MLFDVSNVPSEACITKKEMKQWAALECSPFAIDNFVEVGSISYDQCFVQNPNTQQSISILKAIIEFEKYATFFVAPDFSYIDIQFDLYKVQQNKKIETLLALQCLHMLESNGVRYHCDLRLLKDENLVPLGQTILLDMLTDRISFERFFQKQRKARSKIGIDQFIKFEREHKKFGIIYVTYSDWDHFIEFNQIHIWDSHKGNGSMIMEKFCNLLDKSNMKCKLEIDCHCNKGDTLRKFYNRFGFKTSKNNEMIRMPT